MVIIDAKGKIPMDIIKSSVVDKKDKRPKLVKEHFLQVLQYPTTNMIVDEGKLVDMGKYLVEHYNYLLFQLMKEI